MKKVFLFVISLATTFACYGQDQTINGLFLQDLRNQWLSSAKLQIGRSYTGTVKDKAVIGVTTGNLHLDSYPGFALLLNFYQEGATSGNKGMMIAPNGDVGIGTTSPQAKLDVQGGIKGDKLDINGTIRSKEVKIETTGWSDFVFDKNYELPTLQTVEQHINDKGHLPDIPSEKEVIENGISVGEMQAKLLQKIEELTLYVIDLKKENDKLELRVNELENK